MLLFSAVVAGSFSLGHIIANDITPAALTALRFMLAAVVMAIWTWRSCRISRRDLESSWRYLLLGSLMGTYFVLMFEGLKTAPAVSTSAVFTLTPAISAIFGYWSFNKFDPASPFGGYKESGFGREGGRHGLLSYLKASS